MMSPAFRPFHQDARLSSLSFDDGTAGSEVKSVVRHRMLSIIQEIDTDVSASIMICCSEMNATTLGIQS